MDAAVILYAECNDGELPQPKIAREICLQALAIKEIQVEIIRDRLNKE